MISHELLHIKYHHRLFSVILLILRVVYWFNPLIWMMNAMIHQEMEMMCDEMIAEQNTQDTVLYGKLLIQMQTGTNSSETIALSKKARNTKERLGNLMLKKHKSHFTLILVVLILGLSTLPLLAYQSKAPEPNPLPSKTTDELTVQSTPLSEVTTLSQKQSPEEFIAMMVQPIDSPKVTCKWGCYVGHEAIDVINTQDRYGNVYAVYAGIVVETGYDPVNGNFIIIDHQNSYQTHYHHLGEIYVTMNQEVSQKEVIAAIGKTGISTGPHLHLQLTSEGSNFQIDSLFEE